jgi:hypothetical protein
MDEQYFLKLGTTVSGPFSKGQILQFGHDDHLRDSVELSNHQGGPWTCWSVIKQQCVTKYHEAKQIAEEEFGITPESETPATEPSDAPRTREVKTAVA